MLEIAGDETFRLQLRPKGEHLVRLMNCVIEFVGTLWSAEIVLWLSMVAVEFILCFECSTLE